jgi:hypothetical protein
MSSKSLHAATRKRLSWKGKVESMYDAPNRHDREAAIKAASLVERSLEDAIKARIIRLKPSEQKALFEGSGALSTFSAKIWIGYATGLFGPKAKHDLESIKDIRNAFAHTPHHLSFVNRRVVSRVLGMHYVHRRFNGKRPRESARDLFLDATRVFAFLLSLGSWNDKHLTPLWKEGGDLTE